MRELPLACSLDGAQFAERAKRWRALGATAAERGDDSVRLTFPAAAEAELRELVRLEGECCPFLDFAIEPGRDAVQLLVSGPTAEAFLT